MQTMIHGENISIGDGNGIFENLNLIQYLSVENNGLCETHSAVCGDNCSNYNCAFETHFELLWLSAMCIVPCFFSREILGATP